jgi:hypothetical protein
MKMKKFIILFLATITFSGCTEEISFNNPAVQGTKDNYFWRAQDFSATIDAVNNTITLEADSQFETLTLKMPIPSATNPCPITSVLGTGSASEATFSYIVNGQNLIYTTGANAQDGQIILSEYDPINKTINGTFRFNSFNIANNPLGNPIVNFTQGVFYKVPVLN